MATIATDGKGNYVALDASGNWVPTAAPASPQKGAGELGYQAAPPETKPPSTDIGDITASQPGEADIPPGMMQGPEGGGAPGRIVAAVKQGFSAPPFLTPEADARARADNNQTWMGRNIVQPAVTLSELPFRAADAVGSGLGQGAYELGNAIDPRLGRDFYMLNQLAPAFMMGAPGGATSPFDVLNPEAARTAAVDRTVAATPPTPTANFVPEYYGEHAPGTPVTLDDLTSAINRADQQPTPPTPGTQSTPPSGTGLQSLGQAAQAIGANLGDMLWDKLQRGDTTELGQPSRILTDAKTAMDQGVIKNRADFDAWRQQWAQQRTPAGAPPNTLAPGVAPDGTVTPPQPAPAGAQATPASALGLTPAEEAAYQATAEGKKLLESQQPGLPDKTAYVPNVQPSTADIEQTVNTSRELKSLGQTAPDVSQAATEIADDNNHARTAYFNKQSGSPVDVANAKAARDAQAQTDLKATWANKQEADASPVLDTANQILAGPDGKRPAVVNAVKSVTDQLYDANGNLETDPELLYGVRKHIGDLLSKEGAQTDPLALRAKDNLLQLRDALDSTIERAAPGFGQYLQNFAAASKPIDTMTALQNFAPKLVDTQNHMQYSRVQSMMKQIVDARNSPGVNPYKSIPDDTMANLWNLRDDLRRSASAGQLARTAGSDTAQNVWDAIRGAVNLKTGAQLLPGIGSFFGPLGYVAGRAGEAGLNRLLSNRELSQQTTRGMEMLRPNTLLTTPHGMPQQPPP